MIYRFPCFPPFPLTLSVTAPSLIDIFKRRLLSYSKPHVMSTVTGPLALASSVTYWHTLASPFLIISLFFYPLSLPFPYLSLLSTPSPASPGPVFLPNSGFWASPPPSPFATPFPSIHYLRCKVLSGKWHIYNQVLMELPVATPKCFM